MISEPPYVGSYNQRVHGEVFPEGAGNIAGAAPKQQCGLADPYAALGTTNGAR